MADQDRTAALRRLAELGAPSAASATEADDVKVTDTGREVYAGGKERRRLIRPAHLNYIDDGGVMGYADAEVGDVVLLSKAQAKRLDELGATVDEDADLDEVNETVGAGEVTDEQLRAMRAADLVAHVNQHPEDRARVRALEEERDENDRRSTVLAATEPTE